MGLLNWSSLRGRFLLLTKIGIAVSEGRKAAEGRESAAHARALVSIFETESRNPDTRGPFSLLNKIDI